MRTRADFILQVYAAASVVVICLTAASEDVNSQSDHGPDWLASDVARTTEGQTSESSENFRNDSPQNSGTSGNVKEFCEINCEGNEVATRADRMWDPPGGPGDMIRSDVTIKTRVQDGIAISSQQATELLVNTWNDVSKWAPRNETSSVCEQNVEKSIKAFLSNEIWALGVFDSWAKPGPSLLQGRSLFSGNYYQCREAVDHTVAREARFKGNYCVVTMHNLTSVDLQTPNMFLKLGLSFSQLGACLPDSCSQEEITQLFQERLQALKLTQFLAAVSADCRTDDREYTKFTIGALFLVLVLGSLTLAGTLVDLAIIQFQRWTPSAETVTEPNDALNKSAEIKKDVQVKQDRITHGVWVRVLLSFSAYGNSRRLLSTSQAPGSITMIPGLRFITMCWIVVGHTYFLLIYGHASNMAQGSYEVVGYRVFDLISMMHLGVDSFFTISGILVSYLAIQQVVEKGWQFNWKRFFFHRYWRLTPTLMVCLVLVQGLQRFAVSGTVAPTLQPSDQLPCEKNWWLLPLYINNIFNVDLENNCFAHAWSLAADFQFYLLSPLMMIPFYYHKLAGLLSCSLFIVGQWITAGVLSYQTNGRIGMLGLAVEWFKYCYVPFYSRVAPFTIGILTGYILSTNKGRVRMSLPTVVIGWVVATAAGLFLIFGFHGDTSTQSPSSLLVATIYNAVARSIWGGVISWVVVACASGYGGPVNAFLSWSPFTVLGRLTYIGYLVQMSLSAVVFHNLEQLVVLNLSSVITFGVVDVFVTSLASAVLVVCVEFPLLNLERALRGQR
jgi:peptidoglycan/LPS O-acetylase OafA/YrhL